MVLGLPRPSLCAWVSLARLPTEAARKLFLYYFLKEIYVICWLGGPYSEKL